MCIKRWWNWRHVSRYVYLQKNLTLSKHTISLKVLNSYSSRLYFNKSLVIDGKWIGEIRVGQRLFPVLLLLLLMLLLFKRANFSYEHWFWQLFSSYMYVFIWKIRTFNVDEIDTWCQFHQHSTYSINTCGSRKRKKCS